MAVELTVHRRTTRRQSRTLTGNFSEASDTAPTPSASSRSTVPRRISAAQKKARQTDKGRNRLLDVPNPDGEDWEDDGQLSHFGDEDGGRNTAAGVDEGRNTAAISVAGSDLFSELRDDFGDPDQKPRVTGGGRATAGGPRVTFDRKTFTRVSYGARATLGDRASFSRMSFKRISNQRLARQPEGRIDDQLLDERTSLAREDECLDTSIFESEAAGGCGMLGGDVFGETPSAVRGHDCSSRSSSCVGLLEPEREPVCAEPCVLGIIGEEDHFGLSPRPSANPSPMPWASPEAKPLGRFSAENEPEREPANGVFLDPPDSFGDFGARPPIFLSRSESPAGKAFQRQPPSPVVGGGIAVYRSLKDCGGLPDNDADANNVGPMATKTGLFGLFGDADGGHAGGGDDDNLDFSLGSGRGYSYLSATPVAYTEDQRRCVREMRNVDEERVAPLLPFGAPPPLAAPRPQVAAVAREEEEAAKAPVLPAALAPPGGGEKAVAFVDGSPAPSPSPPPTTPTPPPPRLEPRLPAEAPTRRPQPRKTGRSSPADSVGSSGGPARPRPPSATKAAEAPRRKQEEQEEDLDRSSVLIDVQTLGERVEPPLDDMVLDIFARFERELGIAETRRLDDEEAPLLPPPGRPSWSSLLSTSSSG